MKALEVMQRQIVTVTAEASIEDTVRLMIYHPIGSLPVLEPWPSISGVPLWNRLGVTLQAPVGSYQPQHE